MPTLKVMEALKNFYETLSLAVARDAMDVLCDGSGLRGTPAVSKLGGNIKYPIRSFPLRWKSGSELVKTAELLVVVAMGVEYRVVERALLHPYQDVQALFPSSVANAIVGLVDDCPTLIIRTRDYGVLEAYAATSSVLFLATNVKEVLKIGTAVYIMSPEVDGSEDVSLGDLCILDGTHSRPLLQTSKDEYGISKCYSFVDINPSIHFSTWMEEEDYKLDGHKLWRKAMSKAEKEQKGIQHI